ncbi:MAG: serine/threonine protein kinase, partial [Pirellulaceae bacterium]|nr:serine/threonine protein kinase [Pirellulaceae bacterium]
MPEELSRTVGLALGAPGKRMGDETVTYFADPETTSPKIPAVSGATGTPPFISGYEIHGEIARGGMGLVLEAWDAVLDREVAIKVLLPGSDSTTAAERFVREAKLTARLPHPGIPPVHALGTLADGSPYLAMKLIRGQTLANHLVSPDRPSLPRLVQIFEQIAQAVGFAHTQGIIHRDLKPLNVMVGAFGEVQVMDWGLAKELQIADCELPKEASADQTPPGEMTQTGAIVGTAAYISPEQARGEAVDARTDVFALGAILFEILTGERPWGSGSKAELVGRAQQALLDPSYQRLCASAADAELLALAKRALAPRAEERFATGQKVAEAVAAYRSGVEDRLRQAETDRAAAEARASEQGKKRRAMQIAGGVIAAVLI